MFSLGNNSRRNLKGVDPKLIEVVQLALTISKVDFGVPSSGGVRSIDQQRELFNNKSSQLDGLTRRSRHQVDLKDGLGKAVDVFAYVDGKASYDLLHLTHIATAMFAAAATVGVLLNWGGHWRKFVDAPHFEIVEVDHAVT